MTGPFEIGPSEVTQPEELGTHEYQVSGSERINLEAIDPEFITQLANRFRALEMGQWRPNEWDWHATHEERSRNLELQANDPYLPKMLVQEVDKRMSDLGEFNLGTEYRFMFEKTQDDTTYQISPQRITGDGTYVHLDFSSLFEVTNRDGLRMARPVNCSYLQALDKIGLLSYISARLPEIEYTRPGIYGIKILNIILRGYLSKER